MNVCARLLSAMSYLSIARAFISCVVSGIWVPTSARVKGRVNLPTATVTGLTCRPQPFGVSATPTQAQQRLQTLRVSQITRPRGSHRSPARNGTQRNGVQQPRQKMHGPPSDGIKHDEIRSALRIAQGPQLCRGSIHHRCCGVYAEGCWAEYPAQSA